MIPVTPISDAAQFVRTHTRLAPASPDFLTEVQLHLADQVFDLWAQTETVSGRTDAPPPFWAQAWAGGLALARYVLDHPETVAGRRVLDLASGSGLVAIAALRAGAASVTVSEIDPLALDALALNAAANGVTLGPALGDVLDTDPTPAADVVLVGDAFYERTMATRVLAFLHRARSAGATAFVGDPGRAYLPRTEFNALESYAVPVQRELEDAETKLTTVWRLT
ncbi:class I SAM-dependent methyltransferase [Streptacidiphilus jiangxiensis]|uniref:Predicted nicotinamide N-methyase n=1 Tax=Streptacidiphilus jiangxiensis TaxID=235985 RepID=A0A1H7JEG2_STRJI|nr:50S ribosomal protein L11 methyltransferase [Streptacidiphilus jiangxiensis]SEK72926.1 Predicted nicotinamide N-methyase [Streptacidiphilus jiangxiensis]